MNGVHDSNGGPQRVPNDSQLVGVLRLKRRGNGRQDRIRGPLERVLEPIVNLYAT